MPTLIPTNLWNSLCLAINRGDTDQVKRLVEEHGLDVDAFLDDSDTCMPVLMDALLSNGFSTEEERLPLLRYLLEKGANPNICCRKGYNCLHVAVQQDHYIKALDLFLDFHADVNIPDADGANIVYWAIQRFLLRKEGTDEADRLAHLGVLDKMLRLGADLDQTTRYDMNAREWLDHAAPEVQALVARWEEGKPCVIPVTTVQPKFPTHLLYPGVARKIWNGSVPGSGPASSLSGDMLRAVETLRDEAQRNGNALYKKTHKRMAAFVRDTLVKSRIFDQAATDRIRSGTEKLMKALPAYTNDDIYDQLVDQVCVFYTKKEIPA